MRAIIFFALLLFSASAYASETITYTYDELGRLVKVAHSGTANNNASSCYNYDRANNRTNYTVQVNSSCAVAGGGVSLSVNNPSATEGSSITFTVTKSGTAAGTVTVDYATANGTATAGSDYTSKSGTLSFLTTDTTKTVSVTTTDDTLVESSETVLLNLTNPTGGATISDSQGVGTINDNDSGATCAGISFNSGPNVSATEGATLTFTITKNGSTSNSCSVNYATANGTAVAPGDYAAASGTLTFTSAQTTKTVAVSTVNDTIPENDETMELDLSNPTGGSTIAVGTSFGTITANDGGNQPPIANSDNAGNVSCGSSIIVDVVANDTDPEGNYPLSLVSASGGGGINVSVYSTTEVRIIGITAGTKNFSYVVQDSLGAQATGLGTVTVTAPCQ